MMDRKVVSVALNDHGFLALPMTSSLILWFPLAFPQHMTVRCSLDDLHAGTNVSFKSEGSFRQAFPV